MCPLTVDYSWGYTMPCKEHYSYTWTKGYGSDRLNAGGYADVLLIGNRDSLCCDAADMESFLTVLNSFNIHIFAGGQGSWIEPNGRHYAPLPRLPWQEDDVAEVPQ